jgi:hypothetical protein
MPGFKNVVPGFAHSFTRGRAGPNHLLHLAPAAFRLYNIHGSPAAGAGELFVHQCDGGDQKVVATKATQPFGLPQAVEHFGSGRVQLERMELLQVFFGFLEALLSEERLRPILGFQDGGELA